MTFTHEDGMSAAEGTPDVTAPREGLASQLRQLEDFVARAGADGEALPPEAVEMVARLREIVHALDGLSTSFDGPATSASSVPSVASKPEQS